MKRFLDETAEDKKKQGQTHVSCPNKAAAGGSFHHAKKLHSFYRQPRFRTGRSEIFTSALFH